MGTHKVSLDLTAEQFLFIFQDCLDVGIDAQTLYMRKRIHFKLSRDEFILAVRGNETAPWFQACGSLSKTSFISDSKQVGVSFVVNSCFKTHDHSICVRCETDIADPKRPFVCNFSLQPMLQSCSMKLSIPWNTNKHFIFSAPVHNDEPEYVYHAHSSSFGDSSAPQSPQ